MRLWRWLAAAVVWLFAVAVVAVVAWFAIASAGREVAGADHAMSLVSAVQPSGARATTPATVARTPSPSSPTLGAVRPDSGIDAGTPSVTPSVSDSGGGLTGTFSSAGGDVTVQCVARKVAAWTTQVADGWRIDQAVSRAGGPLRVLFVAGDGRRAGVEATCPSGQPSFSATP